MYSAQPSKQDCLSPNLRKSKGKQDMFKPNKKKSAKGKSVKKVTEENK